MLRTCWSSNTVRSALSRSLSMLRGVSVTGTASRRAALVSMEASTATAGGGKTLVNQTPADSAISRLKGLPSLPKRWITLPKMLTNPCRLRGLAIQDVESTGDRLGQRQTRERRQQSLADNVDQAAGGQLVDQFRIGLSD